MYMYICKCVYISACASVRIYGCVYVCVGTLFLSVEKLFNCLSCRYLG